MVCSGFAFYLGLDVFGLWVCVIVVVLPMGGGFGCCCIDTVCVSFMVVCLVLVFGYC